VQTPTAEVTVTAVFTNLISDLVFVGLVTLARWWVSRMSRTDPRNRKMGMAMIATLWVVSNAIYWLFGLPFFTLFVFAITLVSGWVCYRELYQFWRIDLVGADAQTRDGIDYEKSLRMCATSLDFIGIGASKLTGLQIAFEEAVNRCDRPGRPIRLLLSRPDSEGLRRIARKAGTDPGAYQRRVRQSLEAIARLKEQEKNLQVRFYKDFPAFRLMFINDEILLAGHYVLGKGDGTQTPQLHIAKTRASRDINSLYYAFQEYFESIWEDSEVWDFKAYL